MFIFLLSYLGKIDMQLGNEWGRNSAPQVWQIKLCRASSEDFDNPAHLHSFGQVQNMVVQRSR